MTIRLLNVAAIAGIFLIALTLWAWGQPMLSKSGEVRLWVNQIWSSENSQQVADWYTVAHVIHGMLVAVIGRALGRWLSFPAIYAIAIAMGVGWEIFEHTEWVFERFRATALYRVYVGDTVLNAVMDYIFMMTGFLVAMRLRIALALGLIALLEVGSALIARDSLSLMIANFAFPTQVVEAWQEEINPWTHPELREPGEDYGQ